MNIEIYPLEKVVINGVSVGFGMTRAEIENALGKSQPASNRYYYYNSEMAIEYDDNDKSEFEYQ